MVEMTDKPWYEQKPEEFLHSRKKTDFEETEKPKRKHMVNLKERYPSLSRFQATRIELHEEKGDLYINGVFISGKDFGPFDRDSFELIEEEPFREAAFLPGVHQNRQKFETEEQPMAFRKINCFIDLKQAAVREKETSKTGAVNIAANKWSDLFPNLEEPQVKLAQIASSFR
jgi:hypothetical protein